MPHISTLKRWLTLITRGDDAAQVLFPGRFSITQSELRMHGDRRNAPPRDTSHQVTDCCVLDITVVTLKALQRPYLTITLDLRSKQVVAWNLALTSPDAATLLTDVRGKGSTEIWLRNLQRHISQLEGPIHLDALEYAVRQYVELYHQILVEFDRA